MLDHDAEAGVLKMTSALRNKGIRASAYPSVAKLKKQMKYAADLGVNFVVMAGEEERLQKEWTVRHMETGQQQQLSEAAVLDLIRTTL
jgi:histidyl-tRNA synthetase